VIDQKAQQVKTGLGLDAEKHIVDRQFRSVHALSEDEGGKLADLLGQFDNLGGLMEELNEETGENSARSAVAVIQQGSGEIPDALQSIRRSLRRFDQNARECIFERPVNMTWGIVLDGTQNYLDRQWDEQVYRHFLTVIADHYPVHREAKTETSPADFAGFFSKNNGIFWDFFTSELEPFLKKKSWNPETWEGNGIKLSDKFKASLQKASEITEGLGLENQDNLRIDFKILPQLPVSKISSVE